MPKEQSKINGFTLDFEEVKKNYNRTDILPEPTKAEFVNFLYEQNEAKPDDVNKRIITKDHYGILFDSLVANDWHSLFPRNKITNWKYHGDGFFDAEEIKRFANKPI